MTKPMNQAQPAPLAAESHRQTRWIAPVGATEILLVRHGATEGLIGDADRFPLKDGHGDPGLSEDGLRQAQQVADRLANEEIHAIYVTSLRRTHQTAAPLAAKLGLTPIEEPDLREVYLGEWEAGMTRIHAAAGDPRWVKVLEEGEWGHIPGAETTAQLIERCMRGVEKIAAANEGKRVVSVVHGGVIAAIMTAVSGAPSGFQGAENSSISHIVKGANPFGGNSNAGAKWRIRCFNDSSHLGGFSPSTHI
jgi:2,3-bisphosphoglycerate-dependent phosphoglycerate mutase